MYTEEKRKKESIQEIVCFFYWGEDMKCKKCRSTMNKVSNDRGCYFVCRKCGYEVGKKEEVKKEG